MLMLKIFWVVVIMRNLLLLELVNVHVTGDISAF